MAKLTNLTNWIRDFANFVKLVMQKNRTFCTICTIEGVSLSIVSDLVKKCRNIAIYYKKICIY